MISGFLDGGLLLARGPAYLGWRLRRRISTPVPSSMSAATHSTAMSRLVSEEEDDDAGMALRTPRASPDSPRGAEPGPRAEEPPEAPLRVEAPAPLVAPAADPFAPVCARPPSVAEPAVELLPADPGGLLPSATAPWPLLACARWREVLPWWWCL